MNASVLVRRFMFFNYHRGNSIVEKSVIHRINQKTKAIAVAAGGEASFQRNEDRIEGVSYNTHAGVSETLIMLFLKPELVKLGRAEKPKMSFSPLMNDLYLRSQKNPELLNVLNGLQAVPEETKKGGGQS
jgi:creatinine amidohydrolase/Fe(II)-dependent formamide hydrolase-like protein